MMQGMMSVVEFATMMNERGVKLRRDPRTRETVVVQRVTPSVAVEFEVGRGDWGDAVELAIKYMRRGAVS